MSLMLSKAQRERRQIDGACGYALGCYAATTLYWLSLALLPEMACMFWVIMAFAALFGLLRALFLPIRFKIFPAVTLIYLALSIVGMAFQGTYELAGLGLFYSAVLFLPLVRLFKNDFNKAPPAWLCHDCGYPLYGLTEPKCPECGKAFDPDRVPAMAESNKNGEPA